MFGSTFSKLLVLLLVLLAAAPAAAQDDKSLYKMGLLVPDEKDRRLDIDVLNAATKAFVDARRFIMVERSKLDSVFTEKDLQSFLGKGNNKLSDLLGLDFLGLVGYTVESKKLGGSNLKIFNIEVRLVDTRTGQIVATVNSERPDSFTPPSTAREAARDLFQSIREAFPPYGYVIKVAGEGVVVDLGSEAGLKKGDALEIVKEGEQIIHPVTGKPLPAELIVIGELKVVSTSPQLSNCKGKGDIPLGSTVRLKEKNNQFKKFLGKGNEILKRLSNQHR